MNGFLAHPLSRYTKVCLLALIGLISAANAQSVAPELPKDAQLWFRLDVERKLTDRLEGSLTQEFRLDENFQQTRAVLTRADLTYELNDFVRLYTQYRFSLRPNNDILFRHRIAGGVKLKYSIKPINLSFRSGVQREYERLELPESYWRNKFQIKYSRKKQPWRPFAFTEWFYNFSYDGYRFDKYRIGIGTDYRLNKRQQLTVRYFYQRIFNAPSPRLAHIFQIRYAHRLKKPKK